MTARRTHVVVAPAAVDGERDGMVLIPGGTFLMGSDDGAVYAQDGEGPVRAVELSPFWIDECAVTNRQFGEFVAATAHRTEAESYGWSFVFHAFLRPETRAAVVGEVAAAPWWCAVRGADWRHPEGPGSDLLGRTDHPVVHVSWNDAAAYCAWAGATLPSEAQWECAARGGLVQKRYPWGDDLRPDGHWRCNIWQGVFPDANTGEDGYPGTAPVRAYEPNGYGLYEVAGNVWEWCVDWFSVDHDLDALRDPGGPASGGTKAMRGGSYLCHDSYCFRYRVAARTSNTPDSSTGNLGFRCVRPATLRAASSTA